MSVSFAKVPESAGLSARLTTAEDVDWIARARDLRLSIKLVPQLVLIKRIHGTNASLVDPSGQRSLLTALRSAAMRRRAD